MENKTDLVNALVYRLADRVDMPISELKAAIEISMFDYKDIYKPKEPKSLVFRFKRILGF